MQSAAVSWRGAIPRSCSVLNSAQWPWRAPARGARGSSLSFSLWFSPCGLAWAEASRLFPSCLCLPAHRSYGPLPRARGVRQHIAPAPTSGPHSLPPGLLAAGFSGARILLVSPTNPTRPARARPGEHSLVTTPETGTHIQTTRGGETS